MKWTSLRVKKPKPYMTVLLSNGIAVESGYVVPDGTASWSSRVMFTVPTHWMPVPKPPKAAKRKGKKK